MGIEIVVLTVMLGLLFDYTNGFHDAANVVATPIATGVMRPFVAITMASIFNFLGATQISGVAQTITSGLIHSHEASQLMVLAAVVGAIFWNFVTWYFGIPSSSSYALVGGLLGSAFMQGGSKLILWSGVFFKVVLPMVFSPFLGFFIALFLMRLLGKIACLHEKKWGQFQIASACMVALSHGLNDAQKSMGIITLGLLTAGVIQDAHIPLWVIGACAAMLALGTASGGFRIIRTMGYEITHLQPVQGFVAETSASGIILLASFLGMPLSSTHMIVGSITGVGAAKGRGSVKWETLHRLGFAWILTLPGAAFVSAGVFKLFLVLFPTSLS